jgi:hypothetical protein
MGSIFDIKKVLKIYGACGSAARPASESCTDPNHPRRRPADDCMIAPAQRAFQMMAEVTRLISADPAKYDLLTQNPEAWEQAGGMSYGAAACWALACSLALYRRSGQTAAELQQHGDRSCIPVRMLGRRGLGVFRAGGGALGGAAHQARCAA